jgi:hypothetical protein
VWLLTLDCVGELEIAAGSEAALEFEVELTVWLVLVAGVAVTLVAAVVAPDVEVREPAGGRCRGCAAG